MSTRLLLLVLFPFLLLSCTSDECSKSPANMTPAKAKKCLADMDAEISEEAFEKAVGADSLKLVKLYIGAGLPTEDLLGVAAEEGSLEAMRVLLEYGAEPDGYTLRMAIWEGHYEVARTLIEDGVNPNETSEVEPEEFFSEALEHSDPQIANLLLEQGIELSTEPTFRSPGIGHDPATNAACYGHWKVLDRVLKETDAEANFLQKNRSILETGAGTGRIREEVNNHKECISNITGEKTAEIAKIGYGIDCSKSASELNPGEARECIQVKEGWTVSEASFRDAVVEERVGLVKLYFKAYTIESAEMESLSHDTEQRALQDAVRSGNVQMASIILEKGTANPTDWSMQEVLRSGNVEMLKLILENGLSPSAGRKNAGPPYYDPLIIALDKGHPEAISVLLDHGIEVKARSRLRYDPLSRLICEGEWDLVDRLINERDVDFNFAWKVRRKLKTADPDVLDRAERRINRELGDDCTKNLKDKKFKYLIAK